MINKVTYVEDIKGQQFALLNTEEVDKWLYPRQVEFTVSDAQIEFIIFWELDEVKESIKKVLKAHYEI